MSRGKRIPGAEQRRRKKDRNREKQDFEALVSDTAAVYTCLTEILSDLTHQCQNRGEDLEGDLHFNRLALDIWTTAARPGRAVELVSALNDLIVERRRHLDALRDLAGRFRALATAAAEAPHEHLEPIETYREQVRRRLFAEPPFAQP